MTSDLHGRLSKFRIWDLLIVFLVIGVVFSNYIWLKIDGWPLCTYEFVPAVQVYRQLTGMRNTPKWSDEILGRYHGIFAYPPLSFLVVVLFYLLFGLQGQMVVMVNSLYIAITLICVYLIGKRIFNKPTGLLAAFILSSFPGFISFSRQYWIEFGLMAYVCLDLLLLLKTNLFENRKYSILLGISLALSFLHKYEFFLFMIGPLLLVVYKSGVLKDLFKARWSRKTTNLALTSALSLGLTSFWWVSYGKELIARMVFTFFYLGGLKKIDKSLYLRNIIMPSSLTFYLNIVISFIGYLFIALFFLSIMFMIIRATIKKEKKFHILFLILCSIIPYGIFSFITMKTRSHILSLLPSIAIIIATGIYFFKNRVVKTGLTSLIIIYSLNLHLHSFFNRYPIRILNSINRLTLGFNNRLVSVYNSAQFNLPRREHVELAIKEILEYIKDDFKRERRSPGVLVVSESARFKNTNFRYYNFIGNYQLRVLFGRIADLIEIDYIIVEKDEDETIAEILDGMPWGFESSCIKKIFEDGFGDFDLIKIYKIPNGETSVSIYKRRIIS